MFDVTSFETIVGAALALVSLVLLFVLNGYRNEREDAEYLRESMNTWRRSSWEQSDFLLDEQRRGKALRADVERLELDLADSLATTDEADELMGEAGTLITALIAEVGEADEMLDSAEEEVVELVEEVEDLEDEVDEAMKNGEEARAFSRLAVALLEIFKPLAFGERD